MTKPDASLDDLIADLAVYLRAAHLRCQWIRGDDRHLASLTDDSRARLDLLAQALDQTTDHLIDFLAKVDAART